MFPRSESRFLDIDGSKIYLRVFGRAAKNGTLLCVHGGPGATHDYLLPLSDLVRSGYRVAFYDALGCGRSDLPSDTRRFTVQHDLEVLDEVRRTLQKDPIHLMGSSYGGLLVLKYATRRSSDLVSLNATGGLADVPFATREMQRLLRGLPAHIRRTLHRYEARGEFHHPEYEAATMAFYRKHLCRLWPWPEELVQSLGHISRPVYETMNGPNEFTIVGSIRDLDFSSDLRRIRVPTLLIHGRYDEVTPRVGARIHSNVPGSRLVVLPRSSHVGFWEERATYLRLVSEFMRSSSDGNAGRRSTAPVRRSGPRGAPPVVSASAARGLRGATRHRP